MGKNPSGVGHAGTWEAHGLENGRAPRTVSDLPSGGRSRVQLLGEVGYRSQVASKAWSRELGSSRAGTRQGGQHTAALSVQAAQILGPGG